MKNKFTEKQEQAITSVDGTILVSAAAGSGKTSVLVERVIRRITDKDNPIDIDRLLIVTFTNAAANKMKERILFAINSLLEDDPSNINLQRQQMLINHASICTIDSFCSNIIRENFYRLGLAHDFRISDENEMSIIKSEAMDSVMDELYKNGDKDFPELSKVFDYGRDDSRLTDTINVLYDFIRSHPFPMKWLDEKLLYYGTKGDASKSIWGKVILSFTKSALDFAISLTNSSLKIIENDSKLYENYLDTLISDSENLKAFQKMLNTSNWDSVRDKILNFSFSRLKVIRGYGDNIFKINVQDNRNRVKEIIKKVSYYFECSQNDFAEDLNRLTPVISQLFNTVKLYYNKLDELKLNRKVLDFGDLVHYTLKLIVTPDGDKTSLATELCNNFNEIIVDEYQDINEAQDMIFKVLSKNEYNLFMVGDLKQSIYRFRKAMPQIFLNRKDLYKEFDPKTKNYPAKIYLDKNFRSRKGILSFVNYLFSKIMSKEVGDIDYTDEESLSFGAEYYPETKGADTSIHILDSGDSNADESTAKEAIHIANTIIDLISAKQKIYDKGSLRPATYGDFCVLLRSVKNRANIISKELNSRGIPTYFESQENFLKSSEVSVAIAILRIIDNPVQDIPLITTLFSPMFNFTPDELSEIRIMDKAIPLYFAIKNKAQQNSDLADKCKSFLKTIDKFRVISASVCVDHLLDVILEQTSYYSVVQDMENGESKLSNLRLIVEHAAKFEKNSGYKGLSSFVRYIDKLEESKQDLKTSSPLSQNAVRIMSIHKSKGLEFPICIIANCSKVFNKQKNDIALNPDIGIGLKLRSKNNSMIQYNTLMRDAVNLKEDICGISEELRVLYVAMTRAKEKLIILASQKDAFNSLHKFELLTSNEKLPPYLVMASQNFSAWILHAVLSHPRLRIDKFLNDKYTKLPLRDGNNLEIKLILNFEYEKSINNFGDNLNINKTIECTDSKLLKTMVKRFNYVYSYTALKELPSKVTASEILEEQIDIDAYSFSKPDFLLDKISNSKDKGIALHKFMEYSNFSKAKENLTEQINYLVAKKYISQKESKLIDTTQLELFFNSDIYIRMERSEKIYREFFFTTYISSHEIYPNIDVRFKNEKIVLQGAIDCIFIENDEVVILDYKTDKIENMKELVVRYRLQLDIYKKAIEKSLNKRVKESILYSLYLSDSISI